MYQTKDFQAEAQVVEFVDGQFVDAGTDQVTIQVQMVDIDPDKAREIFDEGRQVGDWGWKHQIWVARGIQELEEIRAAARFFYGWSEGSESVRSLGDGRFEFEAWYAC